MQADDVTVGHCRKCFVCLPQMVIYVCCLGCVCFPDFVDLESRMVFIPLLNYVMRGIF